MSPTLKLSLCPTVSREDRNIFEAFISMTARADHIHTDAHAHVHSPLHIRTSTHTHKRMSAKSLSRVGRARRRGASESKSCLPTFGLFRVRFSAGNCARVSVSYYPSRIPPPSPPSCQPPRRAHPARRRWDSLQMRGQLSEARNASIMPLLG